MHQQYADIWAIDEKDPLLGPEGGESVKDVASRLAKVMATMESEFEGYLFLSQISFQSLVLFMSFLAQAFETNLLLLQADTKLTLKCISVKTFVQH